MTAALRLHSLSRVAARVRLALLDGPGGLSRLLPIAVPMIVSQLFDTTMMFVDRLFLSHVSPLAMASCMTGGITAFLCGQLFFGIVAYCATLVAHRFGAQRLQECPVIVIQAAGMACAAYPIILLIGRVTVNAFTWVGHTPAQIELETAYFSILINASILGLLRAAFSGFFAGIGQTRVIMFGNALALVTNIGANYVLIFGKLGLPALGIVGAAYGTVLASGVMTLFLAVAFFRRALQPPYRGARLLRFVPEVCAKLVRYGVPNGIEGFIGIFCFTAIVLLIHAMGEDVAAAITMVFNWDLVSFFPILGVQIAVSTLVGQNLGAGHVAGARQAAWTGLALTLAYTGALAILFLSVPQTLLRPFASAASPEIVRLAVPMLRLAALYLMFDGTALIFSGALRGAGDTFWAMLIGIVFHVVLITVCVAAIYLFRAGPITVWAAVCFSIFGGGIAYYLRFRQGRWQQLGLALAGKNVEC
jgi:MATE family multidrug resistance protein